MARRIDKLFNRDKIVDMMLAGKSDREVAKLTGTSHVTVGNYRREVIQPQLRAARKIEEATEMTNGNGGSTSPSGSAEELTKQACAARPLRARIARRYAQIDAHIARCPRNVKEFVALGGLDRSLMDLDAKLSGAFQDQMDSVQIVTPICLNVSVGAGSVPLPQAQFCVTPADATGADLTPEVTSIDITSHQPDGGDL